MLPVIREIKQSELYFLEEMLYEAIFIPEGAEKLPKDIINRPELSRYFKDFGKGSDLCLVAELNGMLIGAIWIREFDVNEKGFGFVNTKIPELSMAVREQNRNSGVGGLLLKVMIQKLIKLDYSQVSLSVDTQNYAYEFYKKNGFVDYSFTEDSVTMIKNL